MNKKKIINDPVYGFITIPGETVFDLLEHPWFQRLRYIHQLGLSHLVYPGAQHTRFQHTLGAMHLMQEAIKLLREKGIEISNEEAEAVTIAILMHDIGHGPFSHTLENTLVKVNHEFISSLIMKELNQVFPGKLDLAIQIFNNQYPKQFLHSLVSSQLDMDRVDYLNRDTFFSGVAEGVIGWDRIIKMLNVVDDKLVIEEKGIYSVEKFLVSRRLMYWQVYLHKTSLAADQMLIQIVKRAKWLLNNGFPLNGTPALLIFLKNEFTQIDFEKDKSLVHKFTELDDIDVMASIKMWMTNNDFVLADLSRRIIYRRLFKIQLSDKAVPEKSITEKKIEIKQRLNLNDEDCNYFVLNGSTSNNAYNKNEGQILMKFKNGEIKDIIDAADQLNISVLSEPVIKYYLCWPSD